MKQFTPQHYEDANSMNPGEDASVRREVLATVAIMRIADALQQLGTLEGVVGLVRSVHGEVEKIDAEERAKF